MKIEVTETQKRVLLDMLEHEREELPTEIRRSHTPAFRQDMQERLHAVDQLIDQFRRTDIRMPLTI